MDDKDRIISQYVKEKYPELLNTTDFEIYKIHIALKEFCNAFVETVKKVDFTKLKQLVDEQNIEDR